MGIVVIYFKIILFSSSRLERSEMERSMRQISRLRCTPLEMRIPHDDKSGVYLQFTSAKLNLPAS